MHRELLFKIKSLMVLRVVVISVFLGTIIIFKIKSGQIPFIVPVTILIATTYLLTIIYSILLILIKNLKFLCYLQLIGDLLVESSVIYISGGIESPFPFLYILSIIASSIILYRKGSYIIASLSSILYGTLVNLEFYNILHPLTFYSSSTTIPTIGEAVFYTVFLNISAFYLVAFLSSYLSEKLKKTGEELEEKSEDLLQLKTFHESVVKNMGSGLITADLNGRIISFNLAAEGITGYKFDEVRGRHSSDFFNLPLLADNFSILTDNPIRTEDIFIRKNGRKIHLGMNISPLKDDKNNIRGIIGVFQDLTIMKEMKEKVIKSEKLAAIGRIASGIAHEIRNPLASISGSIQVLKNELFHKTNEPNSRTGQALRDTNIKLMDIILRETERLNSIITQFLLYASPYKKNLQMCNIKELITETITLLKNSKEYPPNLNIEIISKYNGITINADPKQIKQVIWNLCLNSIQAMNKDGRMTISVNKKNGNSFYYKPDDEAVEIIIKDTGAGISEADLQKIFDPFFTTKEEGTGLGLSTVQKIIEGHNGNINIESKERYGTTVKITLPVS